jgi:hypothetical protein
MHRNADFKIDSVSEYLRELSTFEQRHIAQWFYRGHSDQSYELKPGLFRLADAKNESFASWSDLESELLSSFRREAHPHLTREPDDDEGWLCLAQHHGLPTRLLDWSTQPLVALYFAVESHPCTPGDVWALGFPSTNNCHPESSYFARRKTLLSSGFILSPRHYSPRITNQCGCFTIHDSEEPLDLQNNFKGVLTFVRFHVPEVRKPRLRQELYELGIHETFIYPGLDGVSKRLKYEFTSKHSRHTRLV